MALQIAQDPAADALLSRDPLALLVGMVLDQQFPMERAFASPYLLAQRLGTDHLDARHIAEMNPEELVRVFTGPPALHRFPGSMAARVQSVCRLIVAEHDGDAAAIWTGVDSGTELLRRLEALPGFGKQKARIFLALLAKQFDVRPDGWLAAAEPYGADGSHRSVADVTSAESLAAVREFKRAAKAATKSG